MRSKGVLRAWGMRRDNFWPALRAHLPFVIVSVIVVIGFGVVNNSLNLPRSFWFTIALYPIWGIAQQFALQNLIGRNLTALSSKPLVIAVVASLMFGVAHLPRLDLVALTLVAGIFLTLVYRRNPNLWAVGIVHGILGSMAFYIILKEDPGGVILRFLFGG
ncbi:MAG: CPBP family intramembrane metalloprotease [Anaerolineae bacterium]|nr:CPBP family intramembrane metalloprotease [Anaerolineae bacterium]